MMKTALLKTHYSPEEAYSMITLLDELREGIWNNYRDEIIDYCRQQQTEENTLSSTGIVDDIIPF